MMIKKIKLKNKTFKNNIFLAPLCGYTNFTFREFIRNKTSKTNQPGLFFCEMVKIDSILCKNSSKYLKKESFMNPIGAQVFGNKPDLAYNACQKLEDMGFDVIDFNSACSVPKVVKALSGAFLLKDIALLEKILKKMISAVSIPITLKIRMGWASDSINALEILKMAESIGITAITIHGRTRSQRYSGKANLEIIKKCKEKAKNIHVIGNGDLKTVQDIKTMFDYTRCDGVMLARGILENPNLIEETIQEHEKKDITKTSKKETILKHLLCIQKNLDDRKTVFSMKKVCMWYLKNGYGLKHLRIAVNKAEDCEEILSFIKECEGLE